MIKLFANLNTTSSVGVLTRLNDPKVLAKLGIGVKNGLFVLICIAVKLLEFEELRVIEPFFNVEGDR